MRPTGPLLLDLDEIPAEGLDLDRQVPLAEPPGGAGGLMLSGPARIRAHVEKGLRGVDFSGCVEATVRQECSRCLEGVETRLAPEFTLVLVTDVADHGPEERRTAPEEFGEFPVQGARVDLVEIVREQVQLNLPLKPLCRADCAGLCPTCGVNRNRIECPCRSQEVDPRLAPLAEWQRRSSPQRKVSDPGPESVERDDRDTRE